MFYLFLILFIVLLLIGAVIFKYLEGNYDKVSDDKYKYCDILKTPNGLFVPTYKKQTLFITCGGGIELWGDDINYYNSFKSKEKAKEFLDKWLDMKGVNVKSVGIN